MNKGTNHLAIQTGKKEVNIDQAFLELFLNKAEFIWLPVKMVWQERNYWIWVVSYPRGAQQKSSWLISTVLELIIFCICLSKHPVLLNRNAHCLFRLSSAQPHWISASVDEHFSVLAPVSEQKSNLLVFSQVAPKLKWNSYQWLLWQDLREVFCHLTSSSHNKAQRVEKSFLTNLEGYELLVNNHRALDLFFRYVSLISEHSFKSGAQCLAQIYTLIFQKD